MARPAASARPSALPRRPLPSAAGPCLPGGQPPQASAFPSGARIFLFRRRRPNLRERPRIPSFAERPPARFPFASP